LPAGASGPDGAQPARAREGRDAVGPPVPRAYVPRVEGLTGRVRREPAPPVLVPPVLVPPVPVPQVQVPGGRDGARPN